MNLQGMMGSWLPLSPVFVSEPLSAENIALPCVFITMCCLITGPKAVRSTDYGPNIPIMSQHKTCVFFLSR